MSTEPMRHDECGVTAGEIEKQRKSRNEHTKPKGSKGGPSDRPIAKMQGEGAERIRRVWGDVEVVDASRELRITILPEDVSQATPGDESCCVFARACKRSFQATKVMFYRTVAYVELPDEKGVSRVERFEMTPAMRSLVESFDKGEAVIPKGGFFLKPPRASQSLGSEHRKSVTKRLKAKQAIHGKASRVGNQGLGMYESPAITVDARVRSGTGAVKFTMIRAKRETEQPAG